ncbi:MAG: Fur family transcriptional regulator [Acidobacteriota bacterium]
MTRLAKQKVEELAQQRGLKMTPQRRIIVEYLQAAKHHPTAEEVLKAVNRKFPMTSRATVYNTLNWLKTAGLIRELFEEGAVRFDPNTAQHHHFICRTCGKIEDVECHLISNVQICKLPGQHKVEEFEVTLKGLCSTCLKK